MKKIIAIIALVAATTLSANAQWYVGGSLGFNSTKVKGLDADNAFSISPEIGYSLENGAIGVAFSFGNNVAAVCPGSLSDYKSVGMLGGKGFGWSVQPYYRCNFAKIGNFSIFADSGLTLAGYKAKDMEKGVFAWGIGVTPGCAYSITDKWCVVAHACNIGYTSASFDGDTLISVFGINVINQVASVGVYYNF